MKNLVGCVRSLPNRERYVALAGAGIAGAACATYVCYLLFGHLLIRAAYASSLFWQPSAELQYYLLRADERVFQLLLRPLLASAGVSMIALMWALRKDQPLRWARKFLARAPVGTRDHNNGSLYVGVRRPRG